MSKPFKFRHVNQIVGAFVLLVASAVVLVVFLAGREQGWFLPNHHLETVLPDGGVEGLQEGAEITILGTRVGSVHRIAPRGDGEMTAVFRIRGDYFDQYVRVDSVALLKKRFGLGGDTFVEIRPGKGLPMSTAGAEIVSVKDTEMTDLVMAQVEEIKTEVLATLRETQSTLQVLTGLVAEVRAPGGPVMGILANVEKITGDLAEGEGASALLRDPALAGEIRGIVESVRALLGDAQKSAAKLPGLMAKVDDESEDLFLLLRQARLTLAESQKTLEGLQRHWLLSGAMEKAGGANPPGGALSAEELHSLEGRR